MKTLCNTNISLMKNETSFYIKDNTFYIGDKRIKLQHSNSTDGVVFYNRHKIPDGIKNAKISLIDDSTMEIEYCFSKKYLIPYILLPLGTYELDKDYMVKMESQGSETKVIINNSTKCIIKSENNKNDGISSEISNFNEYVKYFTLPQEYKVYHMFDNIFYYQMFTNGNEIENGYYRRDVIKTFQKFDVKIIITNGEVEYFKGTKKVDSLEEYKGIDLSNIEFVTEVKLIKFKEDLSYLGEISKNLTDILYGLTFSGIESFKYQVKDSFNKVRINFCKSDVTIIHNNKKSDKSIESFNNEFWGLKCFDYIQVIKLLKP